MIAVHLSLSELTERNACDEGVELFRRIAELQWGHGVRQG